MFAFVAVAVFRAGGAEKEPDPSARLPADNLTVEEAKAYIAEFEKDEKALSIARKSIFAKGAKATPRERSKLIQQYRQAERERIKRVEEQSSRVRELKEKLNADAAKTPSPRNGDDK